MPAFYELWARRSSQDQTFWRAAAAAGRAFLQRSANAATGLTPEYAEFSGLPRSVAYNPKSAYYAADAWRTIANAAVDHSWFAADASQTAWADRLQAFFLRKAPGSGFPSGESGWTLDGASGKNGYGGQAGQLAMNAVAGLAAANGGNARIFIRSLWDAPPPVGTYRYYNGLLYFMGLLHCSGSFRAY